MAEAPAAQEAKLPVREPESIRDEDRRLAKEVSADEPRKASEANAPPQGTSVAEILARVNRAAAETPQPAPSTALPGASSSSAPSGVVPATTEAATAATGANGSSDTATSSSSSSSSAPAPAAPASAAPGGMPAAAMAAIAALSSKALASGDVPADSPTQPTYLLPESARAQATKALREIYIGNLPPATTGPHLLAFLNAHIIAAGLVVKGGGPIPVGGQLATSGPIISCRVNSGAQFGFAEFRSIEETILAIAMGGLALGALQLKFGRPKAFVSLYGDDSVTVPQAAQHIRELMAQGVPEKAGPDWPAGAIFPFTVERIATARPGTPLHFMPAAPAAAQPAAPTPAGEAGAAGVPAVSSVAVAAVPVARSAGIAVSQSSGVVTASMGAAALAQTSVSASAAQPSAGPATAAAAPEPDRSSAAVDVTGGVGVFGEEDIREMFGGFGTITRCLMLPAGETPTRVVVEFASPAEADTAIALDGLEASDEPLHVRVMRVDEPLACAPSPCVLLRNTVLQSEVATAQDWADVAEDVAVEARPIAPVVSIHRPSATGTGPLCQPKPGDAPDSVPVLVRFATAEGAATAAAQLTGRRFDGRIVTAHCVPEAEFEAAIATAEAAAPRVDVD